MLVKFMLFLIKQNTLKESNQSAQKDIKEIKTDFYIAAAMKSLYKKSAKLK